MKSKSMNPAPDGYSTVCPFLTVESVEKQMSFLQTVFNADIVEMLKQKDGIVQHGEARIGDTLIMMARAQDAWPATQSANYIFVDNADDVYRKAIQQGASVILEPEDRFYGYREGGVKDPHGNTWWIAQVLEKLSEEEMQRRFLEKMKK